MSGVTNIPSKKDPGKWGMDAMLKKYPFLSVSRGNESLPLFGGNNQYLGGGQPEMPANLNQEQPQSRFAPKFLEMTQPMPQMDNERVGQEQQRARQSILGHMLGSFGQLGGMAAGGDAVNLENTVPQVGLNQILTLEGDYRDRVAEYWRQALGNERFNVQAENQFRGQEANREFQDDQRGKGEQFREGLQANQQQFMGQQQKDRLEASMKELYARDRNTFNREMRNVGVNPNAKDAIKQYLGKMDDQFNTNLDWRSSTADWNRNRSMGGGSRQYDVTDPQFIETMRVGRELMINQLDDKIRSLRGSKAYGSLPEAVKGELKELEEEKKRLKTIKAEAGNQEAVDMYELGISASEPGALDVGPEMAPRQQFQPPSQQPQNQEQVKQSLQKNIQAIAQGDDTTLLETLEMMVQAGIAGNLDEAEQILTDLLSEND